MLEIAVADPWNLTPREVETMDGIVKQGVIKVAAKELGISHRTMEVYLMRARDKMQAGNVVHAALLWDRFRSARP